MTAPRKRRAKTNVAVNTWVAQSREALGEEAARVGVWVGVALEPEVARLLRTARGGARERLLARLERAVLMVFRVTAEDVTSNDAPGEEATR